MSSVTRTISEAMHSGQMWRVMMRIAPAPCSLTALM